MSYGGDPRCNYASYGAYGYGNNYGGGNPYNSYDPRYAFNNAPSWGYIILYLVTICISIVGNSLFCLMIKKVPNLRRTHHFFFLSIAIMDILVCAIDLPFVISSVAQLNHWNLPEFLCKFYIFVDFGLKGVHAFLLVFGAVFLYFWYRKEELYSTESGEIRSRKSGCHKWAIPLAWVLGLGIAIPAGAMATMNCGQCQVMHYFNNIDYRRTSGTPFYVNLAFYIVAFIIPWVIMTVPFLALLMQLCGARSPRLDPPHSRTAWIMVVFILTFIATRAPNDIFELMKMFGNQFGNRGDMLDRGMPYTSPETQLTLMSIVYTSCMVHPIMFFILAPEYRMGLKEMWKNLSCNKSHSQREQEQVYSKQNQRKYQAAPPIIKGGGRGRGKGKGDKQLVAEVQPMIMPSQKPLLNQMQGQVTAGTPYIGGTTYIQGKNIAGTPYIPMQQLGNTSADPQMNCSLMENSFDNSFESPESQLPARFTSGKFQYIDTARVEPKTAYTPTNTPPKTPQIPHFDVKPFKQPNYVDGTWTYPTESDPYTGLMPASQIPIEGYKTPIDPSTPSSDVPVDIDDQLKPEPAEDPMEIESLENSPGCTLRSSIRGKPEVFQLAQSPGQKRREPFKSDTLPANGRENGIKENGRKSETLPMQNKVEITMSGSGRTRSKQDLCPDRPRSRFEHAV